MAELQMQRRTKEEIQKALDDVLAEAEKWDDVFDGADIRRVQIHSNEEAPDETSRLFVERRRDGRYTLRANRMGIANHHDASSEVVAGYMGRRGFQSRTPNPFLGAFYRDLQRQAADYLFTKEAERRGVDFTGMFID